MFSFINYYDKFRLVVLNICYDIFNYLLIYVVLSFFVDVVFVKFLLKY